MKLPTLEMGEIEVLTIDEKDGKWEPDWEPLRGTRIGDQFSVVARQTIDHALHGLSRPLVDALGIPPSGALLKLPQDARECRLRRRCPFYEPKQCHPRASKMPWCYEPDGIDDDLERLAAAKAIEEWRQGVYLVIVRETLDA